MPSPARPRANYRPDAAAPPPPAYPKRQVIDLTQPPRVYVKQSGIPTSGRGLFTRDYIAKTQWNCEYGGKIFFYSPRLAAFL